MLIASSSRPLYFQVKESIKNSIASSDLKPGHRLPGERQLMASYEVSRVTVRQAIAELVYDGLLYRHHGKGTFVAPSRIERPIARLVGYGEELTNDGLDSTISVVNSGFEDPSDELKHKLKLRNGDKVLNVTRIFLAGGEPLLLDRAYLTPEVGKFLLAVDLTKDLFYPIFEQYGIKITRGEQEIRAKVCSQKEAQLLKTVPGLAMLSVTRLTFAQNDIPVSFSLALYRGDRYGYKVELKR
jgi:GntR family transcriptional regulator